MEELILWWSTMFLFITNMLASKKFVNYVNNYAEKADSWIQILKKSRRDLCDSCGWTEDERRYKQSKLARVATLPTRPTVVRRTNHENRIFEALTHGSPARTVFILIAAISIVQFGQIHPSAYAFQIKEFGGEPQITLGDRTSSVVTTPIGSCIEV